MEFLNCLAIPQVYVSLNPALYSSVIIAEPVCLFFLFPWFPSAPVPLFEFSQSSRETSLVGESVRFPQTTDLTKFSFHGKFERLTITELFQKDLVSLRGIAFHDIFNCSGHILVLHSAQKTNKLEQDMRSEGPCQLTGRVNSVSERPVEGSEATQSTFELTSAPMINICFFV